MAKEKWIYLFGTITIIGIAWWSIGAWKKNHAKIDDGNIDDKTTNTETKPKYNTGSGTNHPKGFDSSEPTIQSMIGKDAYAKYGSLGVYKKDGTLYKTAKKDEWLGKITSVSGGKIFLSGDFYYVYEAAAEGIYTK